MVQIMIFHPFFSIMFHRNGEWLLKVEFRAGGLNHGMVMFVVHLLALCLLHIVCDGAACFLYACCVRNNDALSLKSDTRDIQFLL